MALLAARGLVKSYGGKRVVDGVELSLEAGEIVGLLGRNGAGKTTTFRMIMGLTRPEAGTVELEGSPITALPVYRRAALGLGFLAQEPSVFQGLTVEENLLAVMELGNLRGQEARSRAAELLSEYGLSPLAHRRGGTLSGGEKRRLEICRCLARNPRVVLLDEPFAGIDPIAVQEMQALIRRLSGRGIAILLTDHNVRDTLQVTHRSYIIDQGKVLMQGRPQELLDDPRVRERYLGPDFRM